MRLESREDILALAKADPELANVLPSTSWSDEDPRAMVQTIRAMLEDFPPPPADPRVHESTTNYEAKDGTKHRILVFTPANVHDDKRLPLLVWYHGGGGCVGSPELSIEMCRRLVVDHHINIVAPAYRLSPENKFPTQFEDAWSALQQILKMQGHAFPICNFDASSGGGLLLGGESYGAHLSAILALQARDTHLEPAITGLYLSAGGYIPHKRAQEVLPPHLADLLLSPTQPECTRAPILSKEAAACFSACREDDDTSPFARAINWPPRPEFGDKTFAQMPRSYFQACGMDINRDDSLILEKVLKENGTETKLDVYPGCPHCFWGLFPSTQAGQLWKQDTKKGMRWLLGRA